MFLGAWFLGAGEPQDPSLPDDSAMSQTNEAREIQGKEIYERRRRKSKRERIEAP
jgi:hypothetical protein